MKEVTIYTTKICPYCVKAKMLLTKKGVKYNEVDVSDQSERDKMIERTNGAKTVPQIYIGDDLIGGADDLYELESQKKLDDKLNAS